MPRWAAVSLAALLAGGITAALGWLLLAMVGWLTTVAAAAVAIATGGPVAALSARAVLRLPATTSSRSQSWWWVAAIAVAVTASLWNAGHHAQHLVVDRDPGVYLVTAKWLADHDGLQIDGPTGAFEDDAGIRPGGAGFAGSRGAGNLQAQFAHLTPVITGVAARIGGDGLLFVGNSLLGGLALMTVFAVGSMYMPARWAFSAMIGLAASLPFVYFTRDLYSEPTAMIVLFGGFFVWELASVGTRPLLGLVSGALIGAGCAARIDGFLALIPATAVFALYAAGRGAAEDRGRRLRGVGIAALAAMAGVAALGWLDVRLLSTSYYNSDLAPRLTSMLGAAGLAGVVVVLASRLVWRGESSRLTPVARSALVIVTVAAGLLALYARFVRPDPSAVEEALASDAEKWHVNDLAGTQAMAWLDWYLGPVVLALGIVGLIALTWRALQAAENRSVLLFCGGVMTTTVVYLATPSISGDQVWAMRRFLPLTLPGLFVAAAWVFSELAGRWRGSRWFPPSAWVVGSAALVLPAALVTWPLRDTRVEVPMRHGIEAVCEAAGPTPRSWCWARAPTP